MEIIKDLLKENSDLRMKIAFAEAGLLFECADNIYFSLDFDKKFASASKAFLEKIGEEDFEKISGKYYKDALKTFIGDKSLMRLSGAINFAKTQSAAIPINNEKDRHGVTRSYVAQVSPMINESYVITGIMVLLNDISKASPWIEAPKPKPVKKATSSAQASQKSADKFSLLPIIEEAKVAAENYDRDNALEIITTYSSFVYGTETDELLQEIVTALEAYECDTALNILIQLEKNLK
jgi:hypothetical protein